MAGPGVFGHNRAAFGLGRGLRDFEALRIRLLCSSLVNLVDMSTVISMMKQQNKVASRTIREVPIIEQQAFETTRRIRKRSGKLHLFIYKNSFIYSRQRSF